MKKKKLPFNKNEHVNIIKSIAIGMNRAGFSTRYLELGIRKGPCFNAVAPLFKEAYAVDIVDCRKFIKGNKNLIWFHGTTDNFFKQHNSEKKFDLIFIDADHRYESSLSDFKKALSILLDNGLILLHDTYPPEEFFVSQKYCRDTYKTASFIRKNYSDQCEIVTLLFYYGVSVVRKLNRQLLWKNDDLT